MCVINLPIGACSEGRVCCYLVNDGWASGSNGQEGLFSVVDLYSLVLHRFVKKYRIINSIAQKHELSRESNARGLGFFFA